MFIEKCKPALMNGDMQRIYDRCENDLSDGITDNRNHLIYHYTSSEGFYNIVTNKKLFFTDVAFLNDSTETVNIISTFYQVLGEVEHALEPAYHQALISHLKFGDFDSMVFGDESQNKFERFFVLACSYEGDSLNLWNYYAKGGENSGGYNIAFDREELLNSIDRRNTLDYKGDLRLLGGRIIYDEKEKKDLISKYLTGMNGAWKKAQSEGERTVLLEGIKKSIQLLSVFFKHESFDIEREYRIVALLPYCNLCHYVQKRRQDDEKLYKTRFLNNMFTPYIKLKFEPSGIKEVGMGPLCENYRAEYRLQKDDPMPIHRQERDILQYGVHQFLRINGYDLKADQIRRSEIPLRF